jgi:hypothetical protein
MVVHSGEGETLVVALSGGQGGRLADRGGAWGRRSPHGGNGGATRGPERPVGGVAWRKQLAANIQRGMTVMGSLRGPPWHSPN